MKNLLSILLLFLSLSAFGQAPIITYEDKDNTLPLSDPRRNWTTVNANEVKAVVNANATLLNNTISTKAPIASPTFTGTVSGITKSMVGLSNVDNTSDASKPVSTAQLTALNLKANLASPTFTGTVGGITKSMVGLGSVDNTSDAGKPVSTAQQTALDLKANLASPTFSGTPSLPSGTTATTQTNGDNSTKLSTTAYTDAKVVDGTITNGVTNTASSQDDLFDALALKADLASPALTGNPTAPTQSAGNNSTRVATTAYADTADALRALLTSFVENEVPSGTINSSNVTFTIANTPIVGSVQLFQNGMRLKGGGVDYSISGGTITFVTAPMTGDLLTSDYRR